MSLEQNSLQGYEPIDSIEQDVPLGHGVQQNFGADTRKTGKGKRASFWKGKGGRQYARRPDGRIITHDAEELGGDDASLANFSGVDSVVVEAPLGHGATQYYAEDEPEPQFNDGITGQDGPSGEPTNSHYSAEGCPNCGFSAEGYDGKGRPANKKEQAYMNRYAKKTLNEMRGKRSPVGIDPTPIVDVVIHPPFGKEDIESKGKHYEYDLYFVLESGNLSHVGRADYGMPFYDTKGAEDSPSPTFDDGITGQDGPETEPSNSHFSAQGYNDKQDESIGMRHRGRHSQSRKDRRDEASAMDKKGRRGRKYDDVATMDAEHNHWHNKKNGQFYGKWSKHKKNGQFSTHNSEYSQIMGPTVEANEGGLHSPSSFDISWEDGSGQSSASMPPNGIHFADFTLEKPVKTGFMVAFGAGLFSLAAVAGTVLVGNLLGGNE